MSMFHELMMRKKEEIMYATIKGSPTESPSGVFSGFSASNYLVLQDDITEIPTDFEIQTRISIPATNSGFAIHFLSYSGNSSGIRVFSSGKLNFYSKNNDNNAVEIIGTTVLSLDTFYFIKIKKVGNTITLYSSTDKITWTTEGTTTTTSTIPLTSKIGFGHCGNANNNNYIFNGSIDLNNSYIKINGTKYNLQAVVGYTVVGSPTITDGVVSGFSYSDYLKITNNSQINNNYEVQVAFNYSSYVNQGIFSFNTGNVSYLRLTDGGKLMFYLKFAYSPAQAVLIAPNTTLFANNNYIVKLKGSNGHHQMLLSSDNGVSWELLGSVDYDFILDFSTFNFGVATSIYSIGFGGSIDLNKTHIKINNRLWFNGQQA